MPKINTCAFSVVLTLTCHLLIFGETPAESPPSQEALVASVRQSITTIRVQGRDQTEYGMGTGFVVSSDGLIATNFHVIEEGRAFTVETSAGIALPIVAVHASDAANDLAIIRVDTKGAPLPALELADGDAEQGMRVLAFGNPLGLQNSVVEGILSAKQMVKGRELLQLAMPVERGNSGGPLVDLQGRVHGIVNMKSAIDDNLGFAIPIRRLLPLMESPNPVLIERWVRVGKINRERWQILFGADWQERAGRITANGTGTGFGGRSLLLWQAEAPEIPFEIAVSVRLKDDSGAAGLAFHCDGGDRHYGFYPSAGKLRLTCFLGPSVYSWQILQEVASEHYLPTQWNDLKVRLEAGKIQCYVNGHLAIESFDTQLTSGKVGLATFRSSQPEFKRFEVGREIPQAVVSDLARQQLERLQVVPLGIESLDSKAVSQLGESGEFSSRQLIQRATALEQQAEQLRQLAGEVRRAPWLVRLSQLDELAQPEQLLQGSLSIAALDNPDLDVQSYVHQIESMVQDISATLPAEADQLDKRNALHRYMFAENGFHGSRSEYYHPANSHLNRVIEDREGLPITLSILYMEMGRRIGMNVEGVGLPGHFVVRHIIDEEDQVLIDVFDQGNLLSLEDAGQLVRLHTGRPLGPEDLRKNSDQEILLRVLNNLMGIASTNRDTDSMMRYADAILAVDANQVDVRMLRIQLRALSGRRKAAVDDLDWMLAHAPAGMDRAAIMRIRAALDAGQ
ncbi:MAG: trypsin-like peptidase domain-containing protein [Planctomycetales bacterium]|nr:trypsin-like peptidase domain-containing protein [Planctomycetales bacterium]